MPLGKVRLKNQSKENTASVFVYSAVLDWQQCSPWRVPISFPQQWVIALEQVRQWDLERLPVAHTKPLFKHRHLSYVHFLQPLLSDLSIENHSKLPCQKINEVVRWKRALLQWGARVLQGGRLYMLPSHTLLSFHSFPAYDSVQIRDSTLCHNKMFISQIGLIFVKSSLGHH